MKQNIYKPLVATLAVAGIIGAIAIAFTSHTSRIAATDFNMVKAWNMPAANSVEAKAAFKAIAVAALQDTTERKARLQELEHDRNLPAAFQIGVSLKRYLRYGIMTDAEVTQFEREQLAYAEGVVEQYKIAAPSWVAVANRATRIAQK